MAAPGPSHVYHFKHGWIPIDSYAASVKMRRINGGARKLAGHNDHDLLEEDPKLTTLVSLREIGANKKFDALLQRHQAEHGAKTSAEQIADRVHNPGVRRDAEQAKAMTTAEKIAARVNGEPVHAPIPTTAAERHAVELMRKSNMPESMQAPMLTALASQTKYPGVVEHLTGIKVNRPGDRATARIESGSQLHVSQDLFGPEHAKNQAARRAAAKARGGGYYEAPTIAEETGRVSAADTVVAHEMGHVVENMIGYKGKLEAATAMARVAGLPAPKPVMRSFNDGGPDILNEEATLDKWVKTPQVGRFLSANLSQYSTGNALEMSAELWMVYSLDGAQAPGFVRAFGDSAVASLNRRAATR